MTDEVLETEAASPEIASLEEAQAPAQKKMLPASRVEQLIKKAKLKGREQMQSELERLMAENESLKTGSLGGMPTQAPIDVDAIKQSVMNDLKAQFQSENEARAKEQLQKQADEMAKDYHNRMSAGKQQFDDFDDVMADFNPAAFPQLAYMAMQVDNTPAVMYELTKNPNKLATAAILAERDPNAALNMINRISTSIKANEQAKAQEKDVAAPLSRLQPSPTGQDAAKSDVNNMSIADFKNMFY